MMKMLKKYRWLLLVVGLVFISCPGPGQDLYSLKGHVLSGRGEPVPDVSVSVRGSSRLPVVTDSTGQFSIDSVPSDAWIIIAPTAKYKTRRIFLDRRESLEVYLTPEDMVSGDDPMTVMTLQVPRRNVIPAQSELNVEYIYESSIHSVDQYMQGRVPGMFVVNRSGMPGSGAVTFIRGVNSINATNRPLYVIDGIPLTSPGIFGSNLAGFEHNSLLDLNPSDISRTIIIRDPTITSTYGSRASNGLILIETLDPSVTQTTIDVDLRFGYSLAPSNLIPQLNADQNKTLLNEVLFTSGMFEEDIRELYPGLYVTKEDDNYIDYQHNTNWQKIIFGNALMSTMNVQVKGGDEIARYGLSFGYTNSGGIIKTTGYQAYNLRFVGRLNIFTWLKMNAGVSLNTNNSRLKEAATVEQTSPILASLAKSPMLNPYQYDIDGNEVNTLAEVDEMGTSNPLAIISNYEAKNYNSSFFSTLGLEGTINDYLSLNCDFNISYSILKEQIFMPNRGMEHYYNDEAINVSKATNNDLNTFYNQTYLRFSRNFGNSHRLTSNTGVHIFTNKFELDWGLTKNAHENDQYRDLQDGQANLREIGGANRTWNSITLYEYLTYSYRDKYMVTGTVSFDGSSRIGRNAANTFKIGNVPVGTFYSMGLAWRISNESFLKNVSFLEDLKLRLTAGKTGNDDIGESSAGNYYQAIRFRETVGLFPAVVKNDQLTYETVSQLDAGLDLSLLGNRFTTNVDLFKSSTQDMIIYNPLEEYFGFDFRVENGGAMENRGLEVNAFLRIIDGHNFKWDVQAMFSKVKNQVTEIKGGKKVYQIPGAEKVNMTGEPAYSFYGYLFKGVYSTQAAADEAGLVNRRLIPFRAGDAIFEDISGPEGVKDGIINDFDKTIIGSPLPDFHGGFYTAVRYRRWSLSGFVQFVSGNDVFNYVRYKNEQMTGLANQSSSVLNRWQYDGQVTDIPRALWKDPVGNSDFSSRWIEDGSYLRLKNVTLSYRIPDKFLVFNYAEFYVSANNMYTLSNYLGYDPEFAYSHEQIYQGVDYGLTPQARQFIAGIKIGF
jgi:TonB-linked SusC/RagA family outer membrane protein